MTKNKQQVWFVTTKNGKQHAYTWSVRAMRSFRISMDEAKLLLATEQAVQVAEQPFHLWRGR